MIIDTQLTDTEIAEAHKMAYDLWSNPRTNPGKESFIHKLTQTIKGELCEKSVRIVTDGQKAICENYSHDIVADKDKFMSGFKLDHTFDTDKVRVEVKHMKIKPGQTFITFENSRIFHARKCAQNKENDYIVVCSIINPITTYHATVKILGVFQSRVLYDNRYIDKSVYNENNWFFKDMIIKRDGVGIYYK